MAVSRLVIRVSVGCLQNAPQAPACLLGPVSQYPRLFRREYGAGNRPPGTSARIIIDPDFDDEPDSRHFNGGMPPPESATTDGQVWEEAAADNLPEKPVETALDNSTGLDQPSIAETLAKTLEDAAKQLARDKPFTQADERPKIPKIE